MRVLSTYKLTCYSRHMSVSQHRYRVGITGILVTKSCSRALILRVRSSRCYSWRKNVVTAQSAEVTACARPSVVQKR